MNENLPDRRSAAAFDKGRLVALSSLLQKQFPCNQLCLPAIHPLAVRLHDALD
jgi:hypothetical protein